jgi:hypothetical protein
MFNLIPFQPSFDTSSVTRMYARLPFPSWYLDSKEENGLSFGLESLDCEILSPCCSFYMNATKCFLRAQKVT